MDGWECEEFEVKQGGVFR